MYRRGMRNPLHSRRRQGAFLYCGAFAIFTPLLKATVVPRERSPHSSCCGMVIWVSPPAMPFARKALRNGQITVSELVDKVVRAGREESERQRLLKKVDRS